MGLFEIFSGKPKQFVTPEAFQKNVANQSAMTPQTVAQLRGLNVTPATNLRLEFFFYTNTPAKAVALATVLSGMQYDVEHGPSASDKKLQVITGWTDKMPMHDATVLAWTKEMCQIGFEHDCEFDGWGTNPNQ